MTPELLASKMKYISEFALNFETNTIHVFGELNEELGTSLRVKFDLLKQWADIGGEEIKEITLDISSPGGSIYAIYAALDFFYELKTQGILVNTRAHGICMSAATVLLSGGTGNRIALPRCKFMLHDVQIEGIGGTANQVAHSAKTLTEDQMGIFTMYAEFSRKGQEPFGEKDLIKEAKKLHKRFTKDGFDHYITPEQMLELNLIDSVI
ncbi:MAG: ATP-dependent Clp protease proteolytic subunit [Bacteroidia bacterium]